MKVYYRGAEFEFKCPDTFNEENTIQRFMLIDAGTMNICYSKGYNKGWTKRYDIPTTKGHNGIALEELIEFLKDWYKDIELDIRSIKFIES